jgi:hypothetical protein
MMMMMMMMMMIGTFYHTYTNCSTLRCPQPTENLVNGSVDELCSQCQSVEQWYGKWHHIPTVMPSCSRCVVKQLDPYQPNFYTTTRHPAHTFSCFLVSHIQNGKIIYYGFIRQLPLQFFITSNHLDDFSPLEPLQELTRPMPLSHFWFACSFKHILKQRRKAFGVEI